MSDDGFTESDGEAGTSAARPSRSASNRGWLRSWAIGLGVFAYFAVLTVWFPSKVLEVDSIARADQWVQDVVVTLSWSIPLIAGFVGLRRAQSRGWI